MLSTEWLFNLCISIVIQTILLPVSLFEVKRRRATFTVPDRSLSRSVDKMRLCFNNGWVGYFSSCMPLWWLGHCWFWVQFAFALQCSVLESMQSVPKTTISAGFGYGISALNLCFTLWILGSNVLGLKYPVWKHSEAAEGINWGKEFNRTENRSINLVFSAKL